MKTIHNIKESFSRLAVSKFQSKRRGMHREIKMNVLLSRQEPKSSYSFCIVLTQRMYTSGTWLEAHPEFCKNYLKPYKNKWHSLVFLSGRSQNPLFAWLQQISSNCRHWSRYSETWRGSSRDDRKVRHFSTLAHLKHAEASYCQNFFPVITEEKMSATRAWKICSFPVVFICQARKRGVKKTLQF